tara:strand:- start:3356 stop:3748 length:393 start_codon:yes stop_codon:yes gene_type:complete
MGRRHNPLKQEFINQCEIYGIAKSGNRNQLFERLYKYEVRMRDKALGGLETQDDSDFAATYTTRKKPFDSAYKASQFVDEYYGGDCSLASPEWRKATPNKKGDVNVKLMVPAIVNGIVSKVRWVNAPRNP